MDFYYGSTDERLNSILLKLEETMSALTDLETAVAAAIAKINSLESRITSLQTSLAAASAGTPDAAIEAQVALLNAASAVGPTAVGA